MLESWAQSIREWQRQLRDIYVYFNNDVGGYAVQNALQLENLLASAATPKLCA